MKKINNGINNPLSNDDISSGITGNSSAFTLLKDFKTFVDEAVSEDQLIRNITDYYITEHQPPYKPKKTASELLQLLQSGFETKNYSLKKPWRVPKELPASSLATLLSLTGQFARISTDPTEDPKLYLYHSEGYHTGIYRYVDLRNMTGEFNRVVRKWNYTASSQYRKEVLLYLADEAPFCRETSDDTWIAVGNGAFNIQTLEFVPNNTFKYKQEFVFMHKVHTNYNDSASSNPQVTDPVTGDVFDVDSFIESYFGKGSAMTQLLWELMYSLVRYKKNYKVCHFFCNVDSGNNAGSNGKSTLLELFRSLLGDGNSCSVKLHELNKDFKLAKLHESIAILVDEVPVDIPVEQCDVLKTLATRDASVTTEKKFHDARDGRWDGNIVYCCNGWPRILEKTGAAERRFYFWNFTKRFYGATDKSFIQDEFIHDRSVHEYILYKILHMGDIRKLSQPKEIQDNLQQYRLDNCNTVHEFLNEFALPDASGNIPLVWSMQPFKWLFAFYQCWLETDLHKRNQMTPKKFRQEVVAWASGHRDIWDVNTGDVHRPKGAMEEPEPLASEYNVTKWVPKRHDRYDSVNKCWVSEYKNDLASTYTGALIRK